MPPKHLQLGKLLIEKKIITQEQLDTAIIHQTITGKKIGRLLVESGALSETQLIKFLAEQLDLPIIELKNNPLDLQIVQALPESVARRNQCIVLQKDEEGYLIGMVDPQDLLAFDEVESILKMSVRVAIIRESELVNLFKVIYNVA